MSKEKEEREQVSMIPPNQLTKEDNKALGHGYILDEAQCDGWCKVFKKETLRSQVPNPLTQRELLSQVSELYAPLGLVTPVKRKVHSGEESLPRGKGKVWCNRMYLGYCGILWQRAFLWSTSLAVLGMPP